MNLTNRVLGFDLSPGALPGRISVRSGPGPDMAHRCIRRYPAKTVRRGHNRQFVHHWHLGNDPYGTAGAPEDADSCSGRLALHLGGIAREHCLVPPARDRNHRLDLRPMRQCDTAKQPPSITFTFMRWRTTHGCPLLTRGEQE